MGLQFPVKKERSATYCAKPDSLTRAAELALSPHRCHQLKVVAIRIGQGSDPSLANSIGLADHDCPNRLDPLKFLIDLRCFEIEHDATRILGGALHGRMR